MKAHVMTTCATVASEVETILNGFGEIESVHRVDEAGAAARPAKAGSVWAILKPERTSRATTKEPPSIYFIDLDDGESLTRRMTWAKGQLSSESRQSIIIFLGEDSELADAAFRAGAQGFLSKPISEESLRLALEWAQAWFSGQPLGAITVDSSSGQSPGPGSVRPPAAIASAPTQSDAVSQEGNATDVR